VKAQLVFNLVQTWEFRFGGTASVRMDCYQIAPEEAGFQKAYVLSWIAFDPLKPSKRVLMDQHRGRPCHIHIDDKDKVLDVLPNDLGEAYDIFRAEVVKHFGEILEVK